jgi:hypothetical protein
VEREIFDRLRSGDRAKEERKKALQASVGSSKPSGGASGSSFLDEWLAKRQQLAGGKKPGAAAPPKSSLPPQTPAAPAPAAPPIQPAPQAAFDNKLEQLQSRGIGGSAEVVANKQQAQSGSQTANDVANAQDDHFHMEDQLQRVQKAADKQKPTNNDGTLSIPKASSAPTQPVAENEIFIDIRGNLRHVGSSADDSENTPPQQ